jgi:hypothetical protein
LQFFSFLQKFASVLPIQSNEEEFFSDKNKKIEIKVKQKMQ